MREGGRERERKKNKNDKVLKNQCNKTENTQQQQWAQKKKKKKKKQKKERMESSSSCVEQLSLWLKQKSAQREKFLLMYERKDEEENITKTREKTKIDDEQKAKFAREEVLR